MQIKTKAIVISSLKYQEKSLIVKCFTLSDGLKSYFVRDAFSNKKTAQKIAYFQPLTLLDIEATHKNKGGLEYFKEIKIDIPFQSIHTNILKSTITMFLSEILHHSIHEEEKNESLFNYLKNALLWLDNQNDVSNFHLILMLEITKHLGFFPEVSTIDLKYFEMIEGTFSANQGVSSLSEFETNLLKTLLNLKFENANKVFQNQERQILLKILIDYYNLHLDGFKKPKSLEVLKDVFL
jgi:DNA repair protein RecO (recombination protein O)